MARAAAPRPAGLTAGLLMAMAGAIGFSGKAIIAKLAYRYGVDAVTVLMYRMLLALPVFAFIGWRAGRGQPALTRRDWGGIVALGVSGYYLASLLDFMGLQYISASLERLILYLNPTLVLALGWLITRKPLRRIQLVAMAVSYAGVALVFGHELRLEGGNVVLGALLVLGSAISYALYLSFSGQLVLRLGALRLAGLATSLAALLCLLHFVALRPLSAALVPAPVLWLSLLNALACTALPVLLVMMAVERIGPALTAQAGMVGPMSTVLLGVWLLDEPLNAWILAGTVLVLAGVALVTQKRWG